MQLYAQLPSATPACTVCLAILSGISLAVLRRTVNLASLSVYATSAAQLDLRSLTGVSACVSACPPGRSPRPSRTFPSSQRRTPTPSSEVRRAFLASPLPPTKNPRAAAATHLSDCAEHRARFAPLINAPRSPHARAAPEGESMLRRVEEAVNGALAAAGSAPLPQAAVLASIARGASAGSGATGRHWVLDPVDGTLGFVRGDQYAVALALVEDGRVVVGVLGCPNMPTNPELIESADSYAYGFSPRLVSKLMAGVQGTAPGAWIKARAGKDHITHIEKHCRH